MFCSQSSWTSKLIWKNIRSCRVRRNLREQRSLRRKNRDTLLVMWSRRDTQLSRMHWKTLMMLFAWFLFSQISLSTRVFRSTRRTLRWLRSFTRSGWTTAPSASVLRNLSCQSRVSTSRSSSWDKILHGSLHTLSIKDCLLISTTK